MPELELEKAKSLFLCHTGVEKNEVDEILLEKCVKRCYFGKGQSSSSGDGKHNHPLALKVLGIEVGDLIREGDMVILAALLEKIETFNLSRQVKHPVFSILRSSFDSLLEEDQLLFVHVALFLPRWSSNTFMSSREWLGMMHGGNGKMDNDIEMRLKCLKRRSLLESFGEEVDDCGMHELWHAFAVAEIEYGEFKDRYQKVEWNEVDDFRMHDLWREFAVAEIEDGKLKDLYQKLEWNGNLDLTGFPKMRMVEVYPKWRMVEVFPKWRMEQFMFRKWELVRMNVGGDVALDVRGLKQLKSLEVNVGSYGKLIREVNGLGTLASLSYLSCFSVTSSACIAELGWLTNLQVVRLEHFRGDKLPDISKLTNLRKLDLSLSFYLQSVSLRNLTKLTDLRLNSCHRLQSVDISGCSSMRELSLKHSGFFALKELNLSSCPLLPSLHYLCGFRGLRDLDSTGWSSIRELEGFGCLVKLEELRAMHCDSFSLCSCRLPNLRILEIEHWKIPPGFELSKSS